MMKKNSQQKKNTSMPERLCLFALSLFSLGFIFLFLPSGSLLRSTSAGSNNLKPQESDIVLQQSFALQTPDSAQTLSPADPASASNSAALSPLASESPSPSASLVVPISNETQEQSESIEVQIRHERTAQYGYHVAEVKVKDPKQLKAAFAMGEYGKSAREYSSKIAKDNDAVLAVNGDYYGFRNEGIIIRNGVLYRNNPSNRDLLLVDQNGDFTIVPESESDGETLIAQGIWQSFSFGPVLTEDGAVVPLPKKYAISIRAKEPRTAIGQIGPLHYLLVCVDGRSQDSEGISLGDLSQLMYDLGCQVSYNLDGGGSSTMVFRDEVINDVSGKGERSISDILYFSK